MKVFQEAMFQKRSSNKEVVRIMYCYYLHDIFVTKSHAYKSKQLMNWLNTFLIKII